MNNQKSPAELTNDEILRIFDNLKDTDKFEKSIKAEPQTIDEVASKWQMNNKIVDMFSDKMKQDTDLKKKYANWLVKILIIQLVLLNIWFFLKGKGELEFSDITFNIFVSGGIAEVFLLVRVIVKYLFSDNLSELLKMVIRTSNMSNNKPNNNNKSNKK